MSDVQGTLKKLLREWKSTKDGFASRSELELLFSQLDNFVNKDDLSVVFGAVEEDKTGRINTDKFIEWLFLDASEAGTGGRNDSRLCGSWSTVRNFSHHEKKECYKLLPCGSAFYTMTDQYDKENAAEADYYNDKQATGWGRWKIEANGKLVVKCYTVQTETKGKVGEDPATTTAPKMSKFEVGSDAFLEKFTNEGLVDQAEQTKLKGEMAKQGLKPTGLCGVWTAEEDLTKGFEELFKAETYKLLSCGTVFYKIVHKDTNDSGERLYKNGSGWGSWSIKDNLVNIKVDLTETETINSEGAAEQTTTVSRQHVLSTDLDEFGEQFTMQCLFDDSGEEKLRNEKAKSA